MLVLEFNHKKATQAINFFAKKEGGTINKMKAIKLLYFAERFHLRKYGRPIVNDSYWALKYGPIQSTVKDILDQDSFLADEESSYAKEYLRFPFLGKYDVSSAGEIDEKVFSETDLEALEFSYKNFGREDQFQLADKTHLYPEWARHAVSLHSGSTRERMCYEDFFENPANGRSDVFHLSEDELSRAKEIFDEDVRRALLWQ